MLNAEVARIRRAELLREAAEERLARSLRSAGEPKGSVHFLRRFFGRLAQPIRVLRPSHT